MLWHRFLPTVQFHVVLDSPPDILLVHAGSNDMGVHPSREIIRDIKLDFLRLWAMFPKIILVRSEIIGRKEWRQADQ